MRVLMCSPDFFSIEEEINAWMKKANQPQKNKARLEWQELVKKYIELKVEMWFIEPQPGLQDMCFTANAGWCRWGKMILSNFAYSIRQAEQQFYELWFNKYREKLLGVEIKKLPLHAHFEGQGDIITVDSDKGPIVLMGYGQGRTDYEAARYLAEIHGFSDDRVIPMRLVDPYLYHNDVASNFIAPRRLYIFYPPAFDSAARRIIWSSLPAEIYAVSKEDAYKFVCNGVFVSVKKNGKVEVKYIANSPTKKFIKDMEKRDIKVEKNNTPEFRKSGGSNRCLSLFLPEEKAADAFRLERIRK